MDTTSTPNTVPSQKLDTICQWIYNGPKYKEITLIDNTKGMVPNRNRKKVGFVVATKDADGVIHIGWSKQHHADKVFDITRARSVAYGRLETGTNTPIPDSFRKFMPEFLLRCMKYFQSDVVQDIYYY